VPLTHSLYATLTLQNLQLVVIGPPVLRAVSNSERWRPEQTHPGALDRAQSKPTQPLGCASGAAVDMRKCRNWLREARLGSERIATLKMAMMVAPSFRDKPSVFPQKVYSAAHRGNLGLAGIKQLKLEAAASRGGDFDRLISVNFPRDGAVKNREHSSQQTSGYNADGEIFHKRESEGGDQH
jgi:hypothetical protein